MSKYAEAKQRINEFYDAKLIALINQIPIDAIDGSGTLEDSEVREALIYNLDIELYERVTTEFFGEFIGDAIVYALRNIDLPRDEIDRINQQRREALDDIFEIEMIAYGDVLDATANMMIGYGYASPEVTHNEEELVQEREFVRVRNILVHELLPDAEQPEIDSNEINEVLEIFGNALENLSKLIALINRNRDAEIQVVVDELIMDQLDDQLADENADSMQTQANTDDLGSDSSEEYNFAANSSLPTFQRYNSGSTTSSDGYQGVSLIGESQNPEGSSTSQQFVKVGVYCV